MYFRLSIFGPILDPTKMLLNLKFRIGMEINTWFGFVPINYIINRVC